jgi:polygalacturonase
MKRFSACIIFSIFLSGYVLADIPKDNLPTAELPSFASDTFSIINYGAIADGITLNTNAITKAIDDCNSKGGGVVAVPPGNWLTGPLQLKSNVNLYIAAGALLQFTRDFDQYKLVKANYEGLEAYRNESPLSAKNAENIAITGHGIIDGNGDAWRMVNRSKLSEEQWQKLVASGGLVSEDQQTWFPTAKTKLGKSVQSPGVIATGGTLTDVEAYKDFLRPNLLVITQCKKILLQGVTFRNSPAWCLHPLMSEHITVRNITVENPWYAQNGDGIDLESCKNVLIENSKFDVGDDGLCMKSGRDAEGRKRAMPVENVVIRNCIVYHAHGGFVIGSEMSGGARNIYISNCTFIGTDIGLRFKTTRGRGGIVENIYVDNITMKDIQAEAILFDMYYMAKDPVVRPGEKREPPAVVTMPVTESTPQFRNFHISNVVCTGADKGIFIRGLPEMHVQNITMENLVLQSKFGFNCQEASGINLRNVHFVSKETEPVMYVLNSDNIKLDAITYNKNTALLLQVQGERSKNIELSNTNVNDAKIKQEINGGASKDAVKWN